MERRQKTSGGNGRRLTLKEWLAKLMAVPLGRCLPEIALCMLVCCMLTGYIVLHLEQKEQYRQDTFEVYLQEHGQQDSTAQTEPEVTVPQKGVTTPPDEAALPDDEVTEPEETTPRNGQSMCMPRPAESAITMMRHVPVRTGRRLHGTR